MYNKDARSQSVSQVNGNKNLISGSASSQERDTLQSQYQEVLQVSAPCHRYTQQIHRYQDDLVHVHGSGTNVWAGKMVTALCAF